VTCHHGQLIFDYTGKSSKHREQAVADPEVCAVVTKLKRRRGHPDDELLAFRSGKRWHDVSAADINDYLREVADGDFSAKDFRTWHATVLAAVGLAVSEPAATSESARKRAVARVVQEVASYLGNTPAVARASYIDPRIISLYERGITIAPTLTELGKGQEFGDVATNGYAEQAVLKLLTEHPEPAVDQTLPRRRADLTQGNQAGPGLCAIGTWAGRGGAWTPVIPTTRPTTPAWTTSPASSAR
jgi:DNA topoisomerase IB